MPQVAINKVTEEKAKTAPIFQEIAKRLDACQQRAFELFEERGRALGHALDDWLRAEHEVLGWPAAELKRKENAYDLQVTLPGFEAQEIEVTAAPNEIVVHAAVGEARKAERTEVMWTEFGPSDVYRHFPLPDAVDINRVTASLEKGILHIAAPVAAKPKPVQVPVAA